MGALLHTLMGQTVSIQDMRAVLRQIGEHRTFARGNITGQADNKWINHHGRIPDLCWNRVRFVLIICMMKP